MNDHQNNIELMRSMGATKGYDPIPPDQYLYFLYDSDPRQKALAWVRAKTIRLNHRSPYCTNEDGNALTLSHMAADFGWPLSFASRIWSQLKSKGLVASDEQGRLCLCGDVPTPKKVRTETNQVNCTINLPPYLRQQFQALSSERQAEFVRCYTCFLQFSHQVEADSIALARALKEPIEAKLLSEFGLKKKPGKKRRSPGSHLVQLTLLAVPEFDVQPKQGGVQTGAVDLYAPANGCEQATASYIDTEVSENRESPPSSVVSVCEEEAGSDTTTTEGINSLPQTTEMLARYGLHEWELIDKLARLCRQERADATDEEIALKFQEKADQMISERRKITPALMLTAVPKLFVGEPFLLWRKGRSTSNVADAMVAEHAAPVEDRLINSSNCARCFGAVQEFESGYVSPCACTARGKNRPETS